MTAQLSARSAAAFDDEIDELEDFDDDGGEDERGLSGLVVLLMGIVMLGALASVVWIAYQYGVRTGEERSGAPYVTADPEPLKIENQVADAANGAANGAASGVGREVYDSLGGAASDPVEVIVAGPEEPVVRDSADPIRAIAAGEVAADDAVADRIAELAKADAALAKEPIVVAATPKPAAKIEQKPATAPTQANVSKPAPVADAPVVAAPVAVASGNALSGSHLVQVGAFRSAAEADGVWSSMGGKYGAYLDGKAKNVEVADLGAKGVYYRLRVGPFASADAAKTYCAGLKERGTDCLIKAK